MGVKRALALVATVIALASLALPAHAGIGASGPAVGDPCGDNGTLQEVDGRLVCVGEPTGGSPDDSA